ncbi:MAG: heavy metal-associated domain-containing protein [Archaeoglobaceae archaeon]
MIVKLSLSGLKCRGCISAVREVIEENGGIVKGINLKEAEVELINGRIEKIIEAIRELGYDAKVVDQR